MKFTSGDRVRCRWATHRTGTVQTFCVSDDSYVVKMDDGVSQGYFSRELEFLYEKPITDEEPKMSNKRKINISYNNEEGCINVKMQNVGKMAIMPSETIEGWISEGVNFLLQNSDENVWYSRSGDTLVLIVRDGDDGIDISVSTPRMSGYASELN